MWAPAAATQLHILPAPGPAAHSLVSASVEDRKRANGVKPSSQGHRSMGVPSSDTAYAFFSSGTHYLQTGVKHSGQYSIPILRRHESPSHKALEELSPLNLIISLLQALNL